MNSAEHADVAGIEIAPGLVHQVIEGSLVIAGDRTNANATSTGVILRGHRNKLDLNGGWNIPCRATFIRVAGSVTGSSVEIRGSGDGGTVLDMSASGLDKVNGRGNEFKLKWGGSATRVIYPGGGTEYNLAPGTQLWIDGELQSAKPQRNPA